MASVKEITFPTESAYAGSWCDMNQCMQGFGCYQYPDGSLYHGYFNEGAFHGYGSLRLAAPYNFTIKGYFDKGKMTKIEEMYFEDNLRVIAEVKDAELDFSEWIYLSKKDRRFPAEILNGLRAVGPKAMLTKQTKPRQLKVGEFDTEQGVYNLKSGFITKRGPPFRPSAFLPCPEETKWITDNCREGFAPAEGREPSKEVCRETIAAHIDSQILIDMKYSDDCEPHQRPGHKYFSKLYAMEMAEAKKVLGLGGEAFGSHVGGGGGTRTGTDGLRKGTNLKQTESHGSLIAEKSESCSSFSLKKFKDPEIERIVCCRRDDEANLSDRSLSMNMSLLNAKTNRFG